MDHSTIRHIKSQAKRLKKTNQTLSYCQCLDFVAQKKYGARHFHSLLTTLRQAETPSKKSAYIANLNLLNDFRGNDWPYFDLPNFFEPMTRA